nr:protocadherin Fat 4 [Onthophagus taurus]XP_022918948.1 protocadherin Fat 4 [Onthophagus taurus]
MMTTHFIFGFLLTFFLIIHPSNNQGITDNRCYLENGASSEKFTLPEDSLVGSQIRSVHVHGDPRPSLEGGNIQLYIQEQDGPISIIPNSKNLTLKSRLDKEGVDGPSSIFINLICERLHTLDPVFVIPVNIRVTDVNDNFPKFVNAPYELNISEVTVVGTRVLQGVFATDDDQHGPFSSIRYSIIPSTYSDYFDFINELEGTLVLKQSLDFEKLKKFTVRIKAEDHGQPPKSAETTLTVNVIDADDQNPKFLDERYFAHLQDSALKDQVLNIKPSQLKAIDQDVGINAPISFTFNGIGGDYNLFKIHSESGIVSLKRNLNGSDLIHPSTLVIKAVQKDNSDRYALTTLTVSRLTPKGLKFLKRTFFVKISETLPIGSLIATFINNQPGKTLKYYVSEQELLQVFSLNGRGELSLKKKLDYETRNEYVFKIFATDMISNDTFSVNITVDDVNEWEPRFRYNHYEFFVSGDQTDLIGRIEAADGDKNDALSFTLIGINSSIFTINPTGELKLKTIGNHFGIASLTVIVTDSGIPPKKATVPVTVHFPSPPDSGEILLEEKNNGGHLILAGLGGILLILAFIVILLAAYICRAKRRSSREQLPSLSIEKSPSSSSTSSGKVSNPMFGDRMRSPTATAMGGIPNELSKSRIPSPKVHPAPQPPSWPGSSLANRVKKLSWGDDKTDSDSTDNLNNIDATPKITENTNLTVYF